MRPEDLEIISLLKLRSHEEGNNYIEGSTNQAVGEVTEIYKELKSTGLNGDFGKTPQYWLSYSSMINQIQMLHMAIKTNDLSLKIKCWNDLLPLCFTTNRVHYARYTAHTIHSAAEIHGSIASWGTRGIRNHLFCKRKQYGHWTSN